MARALRWRVDTGPACAFMVQPMRSSATLDHVADKLGQQFPKG
jgi:hypothetical protein